MTVVNKIDLKMNTTTLNDMYKGDTAAMKNNPYIIKVVDSNVGKGDSAATKQNPYIEDYNFDSLDGTLAGSYGGDTAAMKKNPYINNATQSGNSNDTNKSVSYEEFFYDTLIKKIASNKYDAELGDFIQPDSKIKSQYWLDKELKFKKMDNGSYRIWVKDENGNIVDMGYTDGATHDEYMDKVINGNNSSSGEKGDSSSQTSGSYGNLLNGDTSSVAVEGKNPYITKIVDSNISKGDSAAMKKNPYIDNTNQNGNNQTTNSYGNSLNGDTSVVAKDGKNPYLMNTNPATDGTLAGVYAGDTAAMKSNVYVEDIVDHRFTSKFNKIKTADNHEVTNLIIDKCIEYGFNEEETLMAIAISKAEAGENYDSSACRNKNNVGGMCSSKGVMSFASLEEGVDAYVRNLKKNYYDVGLNTLPKIQKKYCPIGAGNDPNGLNNNWLSNTTGFYNQLSNAMNA